MKQRIAVIVDREGLGDVLLKLPMLRAIRHARPTAEIWWIASHETAIATVLRPHTLNLVDTIIEGLKLSEPARQSMARLRALPHFDMVFDTRTRFVDCLAARFALKAKSYFSATPSYVLSSRRPRGRFARPRSIGERALSLAFAAFGDATDPSGGLLASEAALQGAAKELPAGPAYIGLAPGSREARKNWPLDRFAEIARTVAARGAVPVFILGPFERQWLAELQAAVPDARFPDIGAIDRTLALLQRLSCVVANDGGMGHMTAALGVPLISLFGPTDARRWKPIGGPVTIVSAQDFGGRMMSDIPLGAVVEAVSPFLGDGR